MNFKISGGKMKADFGVVTELSSSQREEYENRITILEEEHKQNIASLEEEHERSIAALEEEHEQNVAALEEEHRESIETLEEEHRQNINILEEEYENRITALEEEKTLAYDSGLSAGKTLEYNTFWGEYQNNGNLGDYSYAFSGRGWDDATFKPKYNISAFTTSGMFMLSKIKDLEALLKQCGVKLTTNNTKKLDSMFCNSAVTVVPELNISSATDLSGMFSNASNLHTIRKLTVSDYGNQIFSDDTFYMCNSLTNLTINGIIGSDINLKYSPLSYDSIVSVIFSLSTEVEFGSKNAYFSKSAVDTAFESFEGANDGSTSDSWFEILRYRPMWNIFCE